jgi:hypothetical protein
MKVNGHHQHDMNGVAMRHAAKARSGATATSDAAAPTPDAPRAPQTSTAASAPVESTVEMVARKSPPGLVRVAARFEAMGAEGRTGGQSNALAQINRNLQRYVETQSMETPPAPLPDTPVVPPAVVDAEAPVGLVDPVMA